MLECVVSQSMYSKESSYKCAENLITVQYQLQIVHFVKISHIFYIDIIH